MAGRVNNLAPVGSLLDKRTRRKKDKSWLGDMPKTPGQRRPRERDAKHLAAIRETQTCLICGYPAPIQAAHVSMSNAELGKRGRGIGMKSDDSWVVPLCSWHHARQHAIGEQSFWDEAGIKPLLVAYALWAVSPDVECMRRVITKARGG